MCVRIERAKSKEKKSFEDIVTGSGKNEKQLFNENVSKEIEGRMKLGNSGEKREQR